MRTYLDREMVSRQQLFNKCKDLFRVGALYIDRDTEKIKQRTVVDLENTFIMEVRSTKRYCFLHFDIMYERLGMIPYRCTNCWKVVVYAKTLEDIVNYRDIVKKLSDEGTLNRAWKWGADERYNTGYPYGIYIYNDSIDEGRKTKELLLYNGISCILKRACSEFEQSFGDSLKWDELLDEETIRIQRWIEDQFEWGETKPQPETAKEHVWERIVHWAHCIADETYKKFVDDELYPKLREY